MASDFSSSILHFQDLWQARELLLSGLGMTLLLTVGVLPISLFLGICLGFCRHEPSGLRPFAILYIEFLRSIPLILFLVFIHYGVLPLLIAHPSFYLSAFLTFILFEAAYFAEIIRGGLRSIHQLEKEAAISLGLTPFQRRLYVFLPLAWRRTLPALLGQGVSLLKDTSLASIVGVIELTRAGEIIYERTFHDFEVLTILAVVYFVLCYSLSRLSERLQQRDPSTQRLDVKFLQA